MTSIRRRGVTYDFSPGVTALRLCSVGAVQTRACSWTTRARSPAATSTEFVPEHWLAVQAPPEGRPGLRCIDLARQDRLDGAKGFCPINLVGEVTRVRFVGSALRIPPHRGARRQGPNAHALPLTRRSGMTSANSARGRPVPQSSVIFEPLDAIAHAMSDNGVVRRLNIARAEPFRSINTARQPAA